MPDWGWIQSVPDWAKYVNGFLIGFFVKWLTSYMTEKGKNLATKEDIGEITKIVEATKNDLGILREEITSVRAQGREAVVTFLESCNVFLNEFLAVRLPNTEADDRNFVDIYSGMLGKYISNISLSQIRLFAYFHEESSIVEASRKVTQSVQELERVIQIKIEPILTIERKIRGAALLKRRDPRLLVLDSKILKKQALRITG